jgi:hypothetical protein
MTGVMVMLGIFALGFVFKIFGGLIALTFVLLGFAVKALIFGGIAYLRLRGGCAESFRGTTSPPTSEEESRTSRQPDKRGTGYRAYLVSKTDLASLSLILALQPSTASGS